MYFNALGVFALAGFDIFFLNGHTVSVSVNSGEHLSQTFDMTRILKYLDRIIFDPLHSSDMTKIFGLSLRGQV